MGYYPGYQWKCPDVALFPVRWRTLRGYLALQGMRIHEVQPLPHEEVIKSGLGLVVSMGVRSRAQPIGAAMRSLTPEPPLATVITLRLQTLTRLS